MAASLASGVAHRRARQPLLVSKTVMDEKVLILLAQHMSRIRKGYPVVDFYVCRNLWVFQHTLDGQMAALRVVIHVETGLCVSKKGTLVGSVRHCDFWRGNPPDSLVQDATGL